MSRRTLMKATAWTVPVIAFAAPVPAFAASPCTPSTNFDGLQTGTSPTSIVFYNSMGNPTGVTAGLTYASNGQGGDSTPGQTGEVRATSTVPSWKYIELEMVSTLNAGDWVTITLTFSQLVTGLSFTIHDIDKVREGGPGSDVAWEDFVEISGTTGYTATLGNNVTGAGTPANPFQAIAWGDNPIDSGLNRVTVKFNGPTNSVVIKYRAGQNGYSNNQHVALGNLSYTICQPAGAAGPAARSAAPAVDPGPLVLPAETDGFIETDGSVDS